jgi:hypothetical protein
MGSNSRNGSNPGGRRQALPWFDREGKRPAKSGRSARHENPGTQPCSWGRSPSAKLTESVLLLIVRNPPSKLLADRHREGEGQFDQNAERLGPCL